MVGDHNIPANGAGIGVEGNQMRVKRCYKQRVAEYGCAAIDPPAAKQLRDGQGS
jgi:hypothetical protein